MTKNEKELLSLISQSKNPVKALETAVKVIQDFLAQSESSQAPIPVVPQVLD